MTNTEAIAQLKAAVLTSQTLGELYALMEDYSYEEFMQVYNQLTPKQQAEIDAICDRDTKMQMQMQYCSDKADLISNPL